MRKILLFIVVSMAFYWVKGQSENKVLNLEFHSGNSVSNYKGVKIGEYYWMDNNFYAPVKTNMASEEVIHKHMDVWGVPYSVSAEDFNRYYGQYYGPMDPFALTGEMYENNVVAPEWKLPGRADFNQLFAMCGTGSYTNIKEYLGAQTNDNPAAVNLNESGDIDNGHWFAPNKNIYKFNLMPGGARMNGAWDNLEQGDFYAIYKHAKLRVDDWSVVTLDNLQKNVTFSGVLYHWVNVRWAKRIPDSILGYKLYIKESDYEKYKNSDLIVGFDISTVDIKKLSLQDKAPNGYLELPNGWIRGFYIQKYGTDPIKNQPELLSHLRIIKGDNKYVFKEKDNVKIYLRTSEPGNKNVKFGLYNPKNGDFRGPLNVIAQNQLIYTCQLPENYIGNFMLVPYITEDNGEKIILKRAASSPWIDRLPLTIDYRTSIKRYISSDEFEATGYMQLNIKDNGANVVNKVFQIDINEFMDKEYTFKVSMPTDNPEVTKIGLFYSNGDFYTDITKSRKGSVYTCKIPNTVQEGSYTIMPYTEENKQIKVIERANESYYMDRLPLVVLEEDIWADSLLSQRKSENLSVYTKDNTLYIKGLLSPATISIYNLNGINLKSQKNVTQNTGISIQNLKSGIYVVQIVSGQGGIKSYKFIKE